jgi:hypothetical protein
MTNLVVYAPTRYYLDDDMKDDEIGRACGMYGGDVK